MVTGATGYVAGHIIKLLLEAGATVHAAVRNPDDKEKLRYLNALAEKNPGNIRYFKADLLSEGSYADAMRGCSIVFHTASPFSLHVADPQKDLIEPAQKGTRNVLEQVNRTQSVTRVVLTSSCAAIYGDATDCADAPNGILTEDQWNTTSSLSHQPYSYSKTLAEKEAWKIANGQEKWKLVVINPAFILGPGITPFATSESFSLMKQVGDGTMKSGIPNYGVGIVDVRDVAQAHLAAAFIDAAEGRHIISGYNTDFLTMSAYLQEKFGKVYPLPKKALPKWLVKIIGPFMVKGLTRKAISLNIDIPWKADNTKSTQALGLTYRPLLTTVEEMFQQLIESKQV